MTYKTLQDKLDAVGNPAAMLQNSPVAKAAYAIPLEFTSWVEEQRSWRESVALMDQSAHMTTVFVEGPDTVALLSSLGVNSFAGFGPDRAKQFVCVNPDGYMIGDVILFGLAPDRVAMCGRHTVPNWVQFHAETGKWNVRVTRDERKATPDQPRVYYRYEVQGPDAMKVLEAVNEGGPLTTRFFNMGEITIAGCKARTLAHGMGGAAGLEIWGPSADGPKVHAALLEAGRPFGMRQIGYRAYSTVAMESGWIPSAVPAIYTGEAMRPFREWLSGEGYEATCSIGGSFQSERIEDYYLTPWDLDYGRLIRFDHDFVGRAALEAMQDKPHRTKVTLVWDRRGVLEIFEGLMGPGGLPPKLMEMPAGHYAHHPYDAVLKDGRLAGFSTYPVYSANERAWISLATVDRAAAAIGSEVEILWGEKDGGTAKPRVERHRQMTLRATVQPWPIHEASRRSYRKSA